MTYAPAHDTREITLAEIQRNAALAAHYAEIVQQYAVIGNGDGIAHALRHLALHVKITIGETNAFHQAKGERGVDA